MKLSELNHNEILSVFDRASSINISYSWFGSPSVSIQANGQDYSDELCALEEVAIDAIRNKFNTETTAQSLINTAYLVGRIEDLRARSKSSIQDADCISRIFYQIREALAAFFERFTIIPNNDTEIHVFMNCYVMIPLRLAQQDGFMNRFPPDRTDSLCDDCLYTHEQVLAIRQQLLRA